MSLINASGPRRLTVTMTVLTAIVAVAPVAGRTSGEPSRIPPQAAVSKAIATGKGEVPGLRVDITELRRTAGDSLTLQMTFVNESGQTLSFMDLADTRYDIGATDRAIGGIHLLDPIGKRKYFVARDSANQCVCSRGMSLAAGRSINLWAKFAAPPNDVDRLTIVIPKFIPIEDVVVGR